MKFVAKSTLSRVLLITLVLLGWARGQPEHEDNNDDDPPPQSGVPRFRLFQNRFIDPQLGGHRPTTSARVPASDVNAALDLLTALDNAAARDQSADLSVSLGPKDDGKQPQVNY